MLLIVNYVSAAGATVIVEPKDEHLDGDVLTTAIGCLNRRPHTRSRQKGDQHAPDRYYKVRAQAGEGGAGENKGGRHPAQNAYKHIAATRPPNRPSGLTIADSRISGSKAYVARAGRMPR